MTKAQRSASAKKAARERSTKLTPEQRSVMAEKARAQMAKLTPEQRSARSSQASKKRWDKIPPEDRSKISKRNSAKVSPERWSEIHKAHHAKKSKDERSAIAKKRSDNFTPEQRKLMNENLAWFRNLPPEERSPTAKKWWNNLSPERQAEIRKARMGPEQKKAIAEKAKARAARIANWKAAAERLAAIENGAAPVTSSKKATPADAWAQDTLKHDLRLLTKADGTLMRKVRPAVAAQYLLVTERQVQKLMKDGTLANEGFRQRRLVSVDSLLAYESGGPS